MIQIAFSSLAFFDCSIQEVAEYAAKIGYDGMELRCREDGHLNEKMLVSELKTIKRFFNNLGLKIFSVSGYSKFTDPDPGVRERNLDVLCRDVEIAYELGASSSRSFGGKVPFDQWSEDYYVKMLGFMIHLLNEVVSSIIINKEEKNGL